MNLPQLSSSQWGGKKGKATQSFEVTKMLRWFIAPQQAVPSFGDVVDANDALA